jgi:hypothetical protein
LLLTKYLGDKVKKKEMGGARSTMGMGRGAYSVVGGGREPEVKRPLGRPRYRWEDDIKMDLQEVDGGYRLDRSGSE